MDYYRPISQIACVVRWAILLNVISSIKVFTKITELFWIKGTYYRIGQKFLQKNIHIQNRSTKLSDQKSGLQTQLTFF